MNTHPPETLDPILEKELLDLIHENSEHAPLTPDNWDFIDHLYSLKLLTEESYNSIKVKDMARCLLLEKETASTGPKDAEISLDSDEYRYGEGKGRDRDLKIFCCGDSDLGISKDEGLESRHVPGRRKGGLGSRLRGF